MTLLQKIQRGKQPLPPRMVVYGTEGIGKAQPLTSAVLTPDGFVPMGDLKVGDHVIGSDGRPTVVLSIHPQGLKDVYRVTFRDGSVTHCCDDHLWFTQTVNERSQQLSGSVRSLSDIRRSLRSGTHFNHAVPRVQPVEFAAKDLPADPWLLGLYLGDGHCSASPIITNSETDIQDRFRTVVAAMGDDVVQYEDIQHRIVGTDRRGSAFKRVLEQLELDECNSESKFVPLQYLHGSIEQRLELLRGLIDSDGCVTNPGSIEYSTVSRRLADHFCFLVRSLGGSARVTTKRGAYIKNGVRVECQMVFRIFASFPPSITPMSSAKHLAKWGKAEWRILHTIRQVEHVGLQECQCIRIDALDSLYVTDDFILTHNSTLGANCPAPIFIQTEDGLSEIDCDKFPVATNFDEVVGYINTLLHEQHEYQTLVIDSLDWLERLIWDDLCRQYNVTSIEKVDGGYAKGYTHALVHWRHLLALLNRLRQERGMIIVGIAHAKVEKFEDPEATAYDRYSPRLHKHACSLVCEWADAVLFATRKIRVQTEEAGFNRKRGVAHSVGKDGGERILRTIGGPACVAKNRFGLPEQLPLSWPSLMDALSTPPQTPADETR
ncbi:MAG: AAA family ATPase [Planctomycetaceae bacterium]